MNQKASLWISTCPSRRRLPSLPIGVRDQLFVDSAQL